jgi:hypothetical protein
VTTCGGSHQGWMAPPKAKACAPSLAIQFAPAVASTVVSCSDTTIVADLHDTNVLALGDLTAVVQRHTEGNSGAPVKVGSIVAGVLKPVVTKSGAAVASTSTAITITGVNFGSANADVHVYFTNSMGKTFDGAANAAAFSSTSFTVPVSLGDDDAGALSAIVTVRGVKSEPVVVGSVTVSDPVVKQADFMIAKSAAGNRVEITGLRFGANPSAISVATTPSMTVGSVLSCSDELLVVKFDDTTGMNVDTDIYAIVTRSDITRSSGVAVKIGTVVSPLNSAPTITASTAAHPASNAVLSIAGSFPAAFVSNVRVYTTTTGAATPPPPPPQFILE